MRSVVFPFCALLSAAASSDSAAQLILPPITFQQPCANVLYYNPDVNPYYDIPYYSTFVLPITTSLPAGDTLTAVSSLPSSIGVSIGVSSSGGPAVVMTPLASGHSNPHCPPFDETVTVADAAGRFAMFIIVDINPDPNY